jgi:hypothetical protein
MKLKGRHLSYVGIVSLTTITLSTALGVVAAMKWLWPEWDMQSGAGVAAVVPSFAGVLLAAFAVLKQVEIATPEVQVCNRIESLFSMARLRLSLLEQVLRDDFVAGKKAEDQRNSGPWPTEDEIESLIKKQDEEGSSRPPSFNELMGFPSRASVQHEQFKRRMTSSAGEGDASLEELFPVLEPVIYTIERHRKQAGGSSSLSLEDWIALHDHLNDVFCSDGRIWRSDNMDQHIWLGATLAVMQRCIGSLNRMHADGLLDSRSLQAMLFADSQRSDEFSNSWFVPRPARSRLPLHGTRR